MSIARQFGWIARSGDFVIVPGYVVAYLLFDWMSYVQPMLDLGITPWSPQAGLTLAFLVLRGVKWAPVTALSALLAEIVVRDGPASSATLLAVSIAIASGYSLAAYVLRRGWLHHSPDTPRGMMWLLTVSAATSLAVSILYVGLFSSAGLLPLADVVRGVRRYCCWPSRRDASTSKCCSHVAGRLSRSWER
jgi:hypothetical protein